MSESAKTIIKYFCDRFLELDYYPDTLKAIMDLQISQLRNIKKEEIEKFKKIDITTLRELSKLENYEYDNLITTLKFNNSTVNNALIAGKLISNAWNKRKLYLKKPKLKVVIAGLDFAGKTSLINRLINDYNYYDIINLEPTIGANVEEYQSDRLDLILWDLGGQKDNIDEYLASPERFFIQVDILIFVFDSQDDGRYDEAVKYLNDIIEIFSFLKENPYIVILLNKADFDIAKNPDYQIKVEYLSDKISKIFNNLDGPWNFEIIPTSIYNYYFSEPEIVRSIKNIFSKDKQQTVKESINTDIEKKLQNILDVNLKLMDKVVSELSEVKRVLFRIIPSSISQSLYTVPFDKVPIEYISSNQKISEKSKRKEKKSKENEYQIKKKSKSAFGPPKRLSTHPVLKTDPKDIEKVRKLTEEELKKTKKALKSGSYQSSPSSQLDTPLISPIIDFINIDSLKPPPPPPKITSNIDIKPGTERSKIISELKELFKKKGLVIR